MAVKPEAFIHYMLISYTKRKERERVEEGVEFTYTDQIGDGSVELEVAGLEALGDGDVDGELAGLGDVVGEERGVGDALADVELVADDGVVRGQAPDDAEVVPVLDVDRRRQRRLDGRAGLGGLRRGKVGDVGGC